MKVPLGQETKYNLGALWLHNSVGNFPFREISYPMTFETTNCWTVLEWFLSYIIAHNGSNNQAVLQA